MLPSAVILRQIKYLINLAIARDKVKNERNPKFESINGLPLPVYEQVFLAAVFHNQPAIVQAALDNGANVYTRPRSEYFGSRFRSTLEASACKGYSLMVQLLLERGLNKNYHLEPGLFTAVQGGWLEIAQMLIDHGAQVDWGTKHHGKCHLMAAVTHGQPDMVKLLLDTESANLKEHFDICKKAYSLAASHGYTTIIRHFVEHGIIADITPEAVDSRNKGSRYFLLCSPTWVKKGIPERNDNIP